MGKWGGGRAVGQRTCGILITWLPSCRVKPSRLPDPLGSWRPQAQALGLAVPEAALQALGSFAPVLPPGIQTGWLKLCHLEWGGPRFKNHCPFQKRSRSHIKMGARMGGRWPQAKDAWSPHELEETGRTLPWSLWRELGPATLLVSDSGLQNRKEEISVVIHPFVVICYSLPRK